MTQQPTLVDLFCGAGGLSLGFTQAGFRVVHAVDNNEDAVVTYRRNLGDHIEQCGLSAETTIPPAMVIAGGPPCQGFSSAGLRQAGDARNSLISVYARIIVGARPKAFVFENVEGFLTVEGGRHVFDLLDPLIDAGYRVHVHKINAANYGVPQHRKRVIVIGGLGWDPTFPLSTHEAHGAPGAHRAARGLPPTPSVMQALSGLPPAATAPPGEPQGHFYRPLDGIDLDRALILQPGQTMRDLPEELQHDSYRRRAFRRVMDGTPTERRGGPPAGVRRLASDAPSKAITGGARSEFLHPTEDRALTIRECARLQTFPDTFEFLGSQAAQAQLIGNAVPPLLARVIGEYLIRDLATKAMNGNGGGALLSFKPTASDGYSPVLRHITEMLLRRFPIPGIYQEQLPL
jgi:DNA (cytosine-5)-methyltransferase 1